MASEHMGEGLTIMCQADGCDRRAVVLWKEVPLCAPHYQERTEQSFQREPVNTRSGQLEPGFNRHP